MRNQLYQLSLYISAAVTILLAVALLVGTGLPQRQNFTGEIIAGAWVAPEINAIAPQILQTTLADEQINLQNLQGYPVIINFWATWCVPCRLEMPELQSLYEQYQNDGLKIIAVNMGESRSTVNNWINEFGYTFDVILDQNQTLFEQYQVRGQPSTYIVSPQGIITHIFYGATTERSLLNALSPFLEG
ncbi:MAG: TlpA disulfide reductase family protein [Aggregatilineales bacterium]